MSQAPATRKRGRPRSERVRDAILGAAHDLLMEAGVGRLTMEAVAARARVGKPTIYRYWANALELAMAALASRSAAHPAEAGSESALADLRAHVASVFSAFAAPRGRQIALMLASADPESEIVRAFRNQIIMKSREVGRAILARAAAQGEVRPDLEVETVLDTIYGPIFFRLLAGHRPVSAGFGEEVLETVLEGIAARR